MLVAKYMSFHFKTKFWKYLPGDKSQTIAIGSRKMNQIPQRMYVSYMEKVI